MVSQPVQIVDLKNMQDLEDYLAERHLRLGAHALHNLVWTELLHNGTRVGYGVGKDFAQALREAITIYEISHLHIQA